MKEKIKDDFKQDMQKIICIITDVEMSKTKANKKRQLQGLIAPVPTRKKSLADELLEKAKGLLKTTNVLP